MLNLSQFYKKFKKFMSLSFKDKILICRIFLLTGFFRMIIIMVPFRKLNKYIGEYNEESSSYISHDDFEKAVRISRMIDIVGRRMPWKSKCLVEALTARHLLKKNNIESTLYLGVGKAESNLACSGKNMVAHAWIRCGDIYVTGGNGSSYAIVAKFRERGKR